MAQRTLANGGFQAPDVAPLAFGYLKMRLSVDATTGVDQIVAGRIITVPLDAFGNVLGIILIWPNGDLSPASTVYITQAFSANGELVWQSEISIPSGLGPFSLS
jgi:hypothetical protein